MLAVCVMHVAVTRHLRDDRRGGNRCAGGVAVDDRALGAPEVADGKAVAEAQHVAAHVARDADQRVAQRREVGLVQPTRVDPAHAARDDDHARGAAQHEREQLLSRLGRVLLGVVQRAQRAQLARGQHVVVEQHAGGDERTGQAAPASLVGAGDERHAEAPVKGEQAPPAVAAARAAPGTGRSVAAVRFANRCAARGGHVGHRAVARARGCRCGRAASRWRKLLR